MISAESEALYEGRLTRIQDLLSFPSSEDDIHRQYPCAMLHPAHDIAVKKKGLHLHEGACNLTCDL